VNNAGVMPLSPLHELKIDEWNRMINVNIRGVLPRHRRRPARHAGEEIRPDHQSLVHGRPSGLAHLRSLHHHKSPFSGQKFISAR
jgi:NAD(P)-dependent dehydrogenase (short-subunit alcohol dehydrogenase family)